MNFNDNQFFYAALWWTLALPGGTGHVPAILARHGKDPIIFPSTDIMRGRREANPFTMTRQEILELQQQVARGYNPADEILPADKLDLFYESLYRSLKAMNSFNKAHSGRDFIDLRQSLATASTHPAYPDCPFSDVLEKAIAAAGIHRHALPQKSVLYLHDDGQIFMLQRSDSDSKMVGLDYPGRPVLPYRHIDLKPADLDHCPVLTWEILYRVVPLVAGQACMSGWTAVNGQRCMHENTASEGQVLLIDHNDVDDISLLKTLTDEEIVNAHPALKGSWLNEAREFQAGYRDDHGRLIARTDDPRIIRDLTPNVAFMTVREAVQNGFGNDFAVALPGDMIIREKQNAQPRIIPKEKIESGKFRFILPPADAPKPPAPGLN